MNVSEQSFKDRAETTTSAASVNETIPDQPLNGMSVKELSKNRLILESTTHKAAIRLEFNGKKKIWLLTEFEKEESINARLAKTTDVSGRSFKDRVETTTPTASVNETISDRPTKSQEAQEAQEDTAQNQKRGEQ
jgi:hypothetical protein